MLQQVGRQLGNLKIQFHTLPGEAGHIVTYRIHWLDSFLILEVEGPVGSLKNVATPSTDDHQIKPEGLETNGDLSDNAARLIMKMLYWGEIGPLWAALANLQLSAPGIQMGPCL